jgi:hypothetical protein
MFRCSHTLSFTFENRYINLVTTKVAARNNSDCNAAKMTQVEHTSYGRIRIQKYV